MHVCRLVIAITGAILALILGTAEIVSLIHGANTPAALRMWTLTVVAIAVLGPLGLANLERLSENHALLTELVADKRSERELKEIKRRITGERDNITRLYPEE
jgi:hypothetical protein